MFSLGVSPLWLPSAQAGTVGSTVGSWGMLKPQPRRQPVKIHCLHALLFRAADKVLYFVEQPLWLVHGISRGRHL